MIYKILKLEQCIDVKLDKAGNIQNWIDVTIRPQIKQTSFYQVVHLRVSGILLQRTMQSIKFEVDEFLNKYEKPIIQGLSDVTNCCREWEHRCEKNYKEKQP